MPSDQMREAFLALGSNLGDREKHLSDAVHALGSHPRIEILNVSPVYESAAHTLSPEERRPAFLNAVVQIQTDLEPAALLSAAHEIERRAGRERESGARWGPRTLDIDILVLGEIVCRGRDISIPHPRMGVRNFVLRPLADLAPDLVLPQPYSTTVRELLEQSTDEVEAKRTAISLREALQVQGRDPARSR